MTTEPLARVAELTTALTEYKHAMEGFAQAIRSVTGMPYPWPAQDLALEKVNRALAGTGDDVLADRCQCGAMTRQGCNDLPSARHCGGYDENDHPDAGGNLHAHRAAAPTDGWIEWKGGADCPVKNSHWVDVRFANGEVANDQPGQGYDWDETGPYAIIAYRLANPDTPKEGRKIDLSGSKVSPAEQAARDNIVSMGIFDPPKGDR